MRTQTAAVDADFIFHVAEIDRTPKQIAEILGQILSSLGLCAVVHPLVHGKELTPRSEKIDMLLKEEVIRCLSFEKDIFQSDSTKEEYYRYLVPELYRRLTGDQLPDDEDVLTYWRHRSSLGEIHSVAMCLICQFGLFLSDDRDSKALKQIIEQQMSEKIDVYNRREVLDRCSDICGLPRADRKAFAHQA